MLTHKINFDFYEIKDCVDCPFKTEKQHSEYITADDWSLSYTSEIIRQKSICNISGDVIKEAIEFGSTQCPVEKE